MPHQPQPMTNKICLITGANAGIGKATALGLAKMGARVVMVCRNQARGELALNEIKAQSGNSSVSLLLADLSSQAEVRQLAADFQAQYPALHVFINNAAIIPQRRMVTVDGIELQLAVNHLAPFLLTNLLLDLLKASAPARIINMSSEVHRWATINFDDLHAKYSYHPSDVYSQTKLANLLFTYQLARRLQGTGVSVNCLHPGVIATNLLSDYMGKPRTYDSTRHDMGSTPETGARQSLYLATSAEVEGVSGHYFVKQRAVSSSNASYDQKLGRELWQVSEELTEL